MFFATEPTLPFKTVSQALTVSPEWRVLLMKSGYGNVIFKHKALQVQNLQLLSNNNKQFLITLILFQEISPFETYWKKVEANPDKFSQQEIVRIRRPLNALKAEKDTRIFDRVLDWLLKHKILLGIGAYVTLLPCVWLILLRVYPLGLLQINNALKPYTDFSLPFLSINVPLR